MTDLIDYADSGEIPRILPGEHRSHLYAAERTADLRHRIVARRPDATGEQPALTGQPYGLAGTNLVPYHPANGSIVDTLRLPLDTPPAPPRWSATTVYTPTPLPRPIPPTVPVPPQPRPAVTDLPHFPIADDVRDVRRPLSKTGKRRQAEPVWALVLIGFAVGLVAGAALLGSVLAAVTQ